MKTHTGDLKQSHNLTSLQICLTFIAPLIGYPEKGYQSKFTKANLSSNLLVSHSLKKKGRKKEIVFKQKYNLLSAFLFPF